MSRHKTEFHKMLCRFKNPSQYMFFAFMSCSSQWFWNFRNCQPQNETEEEITLDVLSSETMPCGGPAQDLGECPPFRVERVRVWGLTFSAYATHPCHNDQKSTRSSPFSFSSNSHRHQLFAVECRISNAPCELHHIRLQRFRSFAGARC